MHSIMQSLAQISWPAIVAVCVGGSAAFAANIISLAMIGRINAHLPEQERLSYLWWGTEVRQKFKQQFPGDKLVLMLDASVVLIVVSFIAVVRFWVFA